MSAPDHSGLPLPDYDHLPVAAVAQRIRSLTADEVSPLPDYEREHANRPAVVQAIQVRLPELAAGKRQAAAGTQARNGPNRRRTGKRLEKPARGACRERSRPRLAGLV